MGERTFSRKHHTWGPFIFYLFVSDNIIIHYCTLARFSRVSSAVAWPVQLPRVLPRVSVSTAAGPRAQRHVCSYSRTVSRECWHTGAGYSWEVAGSGKCWQMLRKYLKFKNI